MMPAASAKPTPLQFEKLIGAFLLVLSLAFLSGCQGVSASGSSSTQPSIGTLSLQKLSLSFGSVDVGSSSTLIVTASNSGNAPLTVSNVAMSSQYFSLTSPTLPVTLAVGQATNLSVTFTPNAAGAFSATATITSNASNTQVTLSLSGTGVGSSSGQLVANPSSEAFGNVAVGSQQSDTVKLTNNSASSVSISQATSTNSAFQVSGVPSTLGASASANFTITFAPTSAGSVSGNVTITSNAPNPSLTIPVSGTGTAAAAGQLTVSPAVLAVGSVTVGSSGTATGTLTASGANVTITGASTNNSAFSVSNVPATVSVGSPASFTVTFSPQTSGAASATLTFTSNAQPSTTTESLTGTGTSAPSYTVNLSWNASTSSDIEGYNVYRAVYSTTSSTCGSFSKVNPQLINPQSGTTQTYADTGVTDGTSYCYAATAVNTSQEESTYSNIVSNVQIPPA